MIRSFTKTMHTEHLLAHGSLNGSNLVMVFASNLSGNHLAGASLFAKTFRGAISGLAEGLTGQSYALPIYQQNGATVVLRPKDEIEKSIKRLVHYAQVRQDLIFQFTNIGNGVQALTTNELVEMLGLDLPGNLILPGKIGNLHKIANKKPVVANLAVWGNPSKRSLDDVENDLIRAVDKLKSKGFSQIRVVYSDIHKAKSFFETFARKNGLLSLNVTFSDREAKIVGIPANTIAWIAEFAVMVSHEQDPKNQSLVDRAFKAQGVPVYDPCLVS